MPRGRAAKVDDRNVSANGYHYIRTENGWRLEHHVIAEKALGRLLRENEMARFADGNRDNLKPDNIIVVEKGRSSLRRRKAQIEARINELQAELDEINKELGL
jgi:hypothetical protein